MTISLKWLRRRTTALIAALLMTLGIAFVASAPANAATYNYAVHCTTSYLGGGCTSPVLSVNIKNVGGVYNAFQINVSGGIYDSCHWYVIDHKTGQSVWDYKVSPGGFVTVNIYGATSTYVVKTSYCEHGYGSLTDY